MNKLTLKFSINFGYTNFQETRIFCRDLTLKYFYLLPLKQNNMNKPRSNGYNFQIFKKLVVSDFFKAYYIISIY